MNLKKGFEKFLDNKVNLDKTRIDRLRSAHNELRDLLTDQEEVKKIYVNDYLQGSYKLKTGIKPVNGGEYDVDVILELDLKDDNGNYIMDGYSVTNWLYNILTGIPAYKDKVEYPPKTRSVRIKYAKELRLDISPVHYNNDEDPVLIVPDWKPTNPKGYRNWCVNIQESSKQQFYFVTRILKYWRDIQTGVGSHPKSILLTTLIGKNISTKEGITVNESLVITMKSLNKYLQGLTEVPEIKNPSLNTENLAERFSYSDFISFKSRFKTATEKIIEAFNEDDEDKCIKILNSAELFKDTFPVILYESEMKKAMDFSEAIKSGKAGITSMGVPTTVLGLIRENIPSGYGSHGDY
ncbi:MAG: nucleotidyltransferase [Ignavibacteria bacterium]